MKSPLQFTAILLVALIGGLIGGVLSSQMFSGRVAFATSDTHLKEVWAEGFVLVDKSGMPRAALSSDDKGVSTFKMGFGKSAYLNIEQSANFANISVGSNGKQTVYVGFNKVFNEAGITFTPAGIGSPVRLHIGSDNEGSPFIQLRDKNNNSRLSIGKTELEDITSGSIETRSEGSIVIFNKHRKVVRTLP